MHTPLRILFIAAEASPFVKIGGLGDVAGSLPPALKTLSPELDIRLVIPLHGAIRRSDYTLQAESVFDVSYSNGSIRAETFSLELNGVITYLISGSPISQDAPVYSGDNSVDGWKYTFFSLAALELARSLNWTPHIIHANDWHTAAAVYALQVNRNGDDFFQNTATLFGVHNLPYLGDGADTALGAFGLPPASGSPLPWWAQHMPLPLALLAADFIVTVSPNYAQEIMTPDFGVGLDGFLRMRRKSVTGILNGIDTDIWNPAEDPHLPENYDLNGISRRRENKSALQNEFNLKQDLKIPLISMISRMDYQKGVDLLPEALRQISDLDWQVIILGTGQADLEDEVYQIEREFPDRARAVIRFDPALSSRLFGGSDITLIPSRYEPCGLTQMIAMRYGCVPVARATGGLVDTIHDQVTGDPGTGFLFQDATPGSLAESLQRAIRVYQLQERWQKLQVNGMNTDFSWQYSARQYLSLYENLIQELNDH